MRALLVDHERLRLLRLKGMLEREHEVQVVGMFDDAKRVEEQMQKLAPDIVFLHIDLPGIGGLELAARIRKHNATVNIVFTGGSNEDALEAYAVYPLDYMRQPIDRERLQQTMEMARLRTAAARQAQGHFSNPKQSVLVGLGSLAVRRPDGTLDYMKWRTNKSQELFAYLLHHRGRMVERDALFRLLWSGFNVERAAAQLYNTIYTIRAVLKAEGLELTIAKGGPAAGYRLELGQERFDVDEWEDALRGLPALHTDTEAQYEAVLSRYTGDYMTELDYAWALEERLRLRELWLGHVRRLVDFYRLNRGEGEVNGLLHRLHLTNMAPYRVMESFMMQNS